MDKISFFYNINHYVYFYWQPDEETTKSPEMKEKLDEVGFVYYLVLARMQDIDPKMFKTDGK